MNSIALRIACAASLVLGAAQAWGQSPIAITTMQHLSFGRFAAGAGGTLTVSPAGMRSAGPGVVLLSSGATSEARYTISGDPDAVFNISIPADGDATLDDGHGHTMPFSLFQADAQPLLQLGAGGTQALALGATLSAAAGQPAGHYTGFFPVYVEYN